MQPFFILDTYFFFEKLTVVFNIYANFQNYVVVKQRIKKNFKTNQIVKTYFCCDRDNKSENVKNNQKQKHAATCLIDCFFSVLR